MKSLREQIACKCIHFNGIMRKVCNAGINYESVRVGKPYSFPCLQQGGVCSKATFLTAEEVDFRVADIETGSTKTLIACMKVKDHYKKTQENPGVIPCECGGELKYAVAEVNGHVRAACASCGISFIE